MISRLKSLGKYLYYYGLCISEREGYGLGETGMNDIHKLLHQNIGVTLATDT